MRAREVWGIHGSTACGVVLRQWACSSNAIELNSWQDWTESSWIVHKAWSLSAVLAASCEGLVFVFGSVALESTSALDVASAP